MAAPPDQDQCGVLLGKEHVTVAVEELVPQVVKVGLLVGEDSLPAWRQVCAQELDR